MCYPPKIHGPIGNLNFVPRTFLSPNARVTQDLGSQNLQTLPYIKARRSSRFAGLTYTMLADTPLDINQYKVSRMNHDYVAFQVQMCNDAYVVLEDAIAMWRVREPCGLQGAGQGGANRHLERTGCVTRGVKALRSDTMLNT